jgi:transcriptional regulator with XRE-family HTH domain
MEMESQKLFWATNLKFLRNRKKLGQEALAEQLGITRAKLNSHENGVSKNPPLEDLIKIADHFHLAVDTLLKVDLSKITELKLRELEAGSDVYLSGGRIRVLAITVNSANKENIEFVPVKAQAGYLAGYNDPEFIEKLDKYSFPHLPEDRTHRVFATKGDSMLIPENCLVITEHLSIEDWNTLKGTPCIVIMKSEQRPLFKMVSAKFETAPNLTLHSLNSTYPDQEVFAGDVMEVWKYHSHITDVLPSEENILHEILRTVKETNSDVKALA